MTPQQAREQYRLGLQQPRTVETTLLLGAIYALGAATLVTVLVVLVLVVAAAVHIVQGVMLWRW